MSDETPVPLEVLQPSALALPPVDAQFSAFGSIAFFEDAQRMAKALYSSSIVPESYRGVDHMGDCLIALEIANRIGASVLAVMQNLYVVHGKPAWSSQFLISCVNASRRFSPLRYEETGVKGEDSWGRIAWVTDKTGQKLKAPEVTIGMAKAEGWYQKNGSKWKTMPELMLCYRTATLFARLYAPELTMGIQTAEEILDIVPAVPIKQGLIGKPIDGEAPQSVDKTAVQFPDPYAEIERRCGTDGVTLQQVFLYCKERKLTGDKSEELRQVKEATLHDLLTTWKHILPNIRKIEVK